MPQITVTLVDRTGAAASASHENFKMGIMQELVKILDDLLGAKRRSEQRASN
jgi:hypothetical protein